MTVKHSEPPRTTKLYETPRPLSGGAQTLSGAARDRHRIKLYGVQSAVDGLILYLKEDPEIPASYLERWIDIQARIDKLTD